MLNCHQATRLVSERQERSLSVKERMGLRLHVLICAGCKNFSLQVPFLRQTMRAYSERVDSVIAGSGDEPAGADGSDHSKAPYGSATAQRGVRANCRAPQGCASASMPPCAAPQSLFLRWV